MHQPYYVTTVTEGREKLFEHWPLARCVVKELINAEAQGLCKTFAYVVMPDHVHWLFMLCRDSLSNAVRQVKSRSAIQINKLRETLGKRVWQKGFYDHALRNGEDLSGTARYIIENPLRAGLVHSLMEYPHWDFRLGSRPLLRL